MSVEFMEQTYVYNAYHSIKHLFINETNFIYCCKIVWSKKLYHAESVLTIINVRPY